MIDFGDRQADARDADLASCASRGDRRALAELLRTHQQWVYAVALRFARDPNAASDLAQDALLRVVTRIAQFEGHSSFRTWAWRIVLNTFLNSKRSPSEEAIGGWDDYADFLERSGLREESELEPPQLRYMLAEEVRVQCLLGMLLCLDRTQRLVFVLGAVMGVQANEAAALFEWTPAQFRKRLERARADLGSFMKDRCGLVNADNPCRCPKKTAAMARDGLIDPERLRFAGPRVRLFTEEAPSRAQAFAHFQEDAAVSPFLGHPNLAGPDVASEMDRLLERAGLMV
ncbi:MAG: RNA polymerase sigma factor [Polyangiaceae bacterium]|nr:RNA polymerase sigma factor [Polyangiaceae bacterium]